MSNFILIISVIWVAWTMLRVRSNMRSGGVIFPPVVAAALLFAACIVIVSWYDVSALHLLWLFPICFVVGFVVLILPAAQRAVFAFVRILAYSLE